MSNRGFRRLRVLVADGDPSFVRAVADAFERSEVPAGVRTVTSGENAVERARENGVDGVVVGDELGAPVEVIDRIDERTDVPVVFVTGGGDDGDTVGAAVEAGADDCFPRTTAAGQYELVAETVAVDGEDPSPGADESGDDGPGRAYRELFENVSDGLVVHAPDTGEILDVNERFCEMNGYQRGELVGESIDVVTAPEAEFDYGAAEEFIEAAAEGDSQLFEWRNQRKDGETFPVEVHLAVVQLPEGERVLASVRDISERRHLERTYREVFEKVSDAIAVFDPETGEILDVNEAYHDLVGYEDLETIQRLGIQGLSVTEEGYTEERGRRLLADVAGTDEPETVEWRVERREGERRWAEITLAPAEIGGERRVLSIQRDVTERKRRERMVRALHDATDRFQEVDTRAGVCEAAVAAAEEVLELSMPTCWLPADDGALEPVAAADPAWEIPGGPGVFEPGSFEYGVYEGEELVTYDPRERWDETPFRQAFLVPLGDHGLLGAAEPDVEEYDEVTLDAARILARHARSALDRVERERELRESERRFRTIAERVEEIIYLASPDLTELEYVNPAYAEVFGRPVDELYDDPLEFFEAVHPEDIDDLEAAVEAMLEDVEAGEADDSYEFSFRIERPDGEIRWIESTGYPILDDDGGRHRYVAVSEDVTERHRRERTLETFHEATRDLTGADSRETACRQAVRAAEDVLGFPLVSTHLYDEETGRLEPVATTDRLVELDVDPPAFGPGDSLPWQVYVEGESTTSTDRAGDVYGPGLSGPDVVLPLGSHGVMLVGAPTPSFDGEDVELAQILAATLEAALNHVADERALADREAELRREQERARRLERLNEIIRDIEQVTNEQSARAGIEAAVCERLVAVDHHDLVWTAEPGVGDDELVPRTSDGDMDAYLDAVTLSTGGGVGAHPAVAAYDDREPHAVSNVATEIATGEWRTTALQHGVQSVVAVPIRHGNTVHGVLCVESGEPDAFDEATREVLAELGRSIGYAITITERERALESQGTTELEFAVDDEGLFMIREAAAAGCRLELERTIRRAGGSFSTFYAVEGADPGTVVDRAEVAASVESAQVVSADDDGDGGLVEVRAPTWFGSAFTDHGAVLREATADEDGGSLVVEAPRGADVRALVERFQERYPGAELVAKRQRERAVQSLFELEETLQEQLTDRQWEALETAYSAGYFAWPRETSGQQVADLLGITQPTFNKHLRIAERTAFRMLLDREYRDETD